MNHLNKLNEQGVDWNMNMLSHALSYAKKYGWQIIPLHYPIFDEEGKPATRCSCGNADCDLKNRGKHPRFDAELLPDGLKSASSDPDIIKSWWDKWPNSNIGIVTGLRSNLVVLDADGITGKRTLINSPDMPSTACAKSGVGIHYYFLHPGEDHPIKTTVKVLPGIDSRGDGGYIVAPPSLHYMGHRYEWLDAVDVAPVPQWWLDLVEKPQDDDKPPVKFEIKINNPHMQGYGRGALQDELAKLWSTPHGQGLRNKALYDASWTIYQLVAEGFIEDDFAYNCLMQTATDGMKMKEYEARKTIKSGREWGLTHTRNLAVEEGRVVRHK